MLSKKILLTLVFFITLPSIVAGETNRKALMKEFGRVQHELQSAASQFSKIMNETALFESIAYDFYDGKIAEKKLITDGANISAGLRKKLNDTNKQLSQIKLPTQTGIAGLDNLPRQMMADIKKVAVEVNALIEAGERLLKMALEYDDTLFILASNMRSKSSINLQVLSKNNAEVQQRFLNNNGPMYWLLETIKNHADANIEMAEGVVSTNDISINKSKATKVDYEKFRKEIHSNATNKAEVFLKDSAASIKKGRQGVGFFNRYNAKLKKENKSEPSYISFLEKVGVTFSSSFEIEENIIFAFRDYLTLMRETSFVPPQDQLNPIVTKLEILYKSREELFLKRQQLTKTR